MRPNCKGCIEEWNMSFEYQKDGLYLATTKDTPDFRKHFFLLMEIFALHIHLKKMQTKTS